MRIVVVSDTHRVEDEIIKAISEGNKPDLILHLGDNVEDGENLEKKFGIETIAVRGNGDFAPDYPYDRLVDIGNKKIFMTHGHRYGVHTGFMSLYYKGLEVGADIVLYGHTHIPVNVKEKGIIIMNPGSPSLPRQEGKIKTYGLIEIEGDEINTDIIKLP